MSAPKRQHLEIPSLRKGDKRVETGPVVFNSDWPGLFVRGDNCHGFLIELCIHLRAVVEKGGPEAFATARPLVDLVELLASPVGYSETHAKYVGKFVGLLKKRLADPKKMGTPMFDPAEVTGKTLAAVKKAVKAVPALRTEKDEAKARALLAGVVEKLVADGTVPWWTVPTWNAGREGDELEVRFGVPGDSPAFVVRPFDETKKGPKHDGQTVAGDQGPIGEGVRGGGGRRR